MGRITVNQTPTDYFTRKEFDKIVDATYAYRENRGETGSANSTRLRTLTLLMRWSGLRIRDAITLERTRLIGDNLMLYQAKTGTPVYVPLPPQVAEALRNIPDGPKPNARYFFWTGNGFAAACVANYVVDPIVTGPGSFGSGHVLTLNQHTEPTIFRGNGTRGLQLLANREVQFVTGSVVR